MQFDKKDIWPKEGKLKKGLIILAIIIVGVTAITLIEEQSAVKFTKRMPVILGLACAGVWFYNPSKNNKESKE